MLRPHQRFYYAVKPYVPWGLRMGMRRVAARRTLHLSRSYWPISESTRRTPDGWPGWPDGKRFAVLLTHDVEGRAGLEKCAQLADVESSLGFRSAFNFDPEGDYRVAREFREHLVARGFEVGVHDLKNDGKVFKSEEKFREKAARTIYYLRD